LPGFFPIYLSDVGGLGLGGCFYSWAIFVLLVAAIGSSAQFASAFYSSPGFPRCPSLSIEPTKS
jgi:hypothetical protein